MSDYVISCCSTADLTKEHFEKRNISYICFHYELNGKEYADDLGQSMPFDVFYKAMQDGASTKTSQVNADEFEEYFEGFLKHRFSLMTCKICIFRDFRCYKFSQRCKSGAGGKIPGS